eukprot:TRINITY_DN4016_c1_g1_i1.p1 TRINITY_DN4016_c1_g1~~TRINITY_DN4016_c1_g1_i1.p1  ORF type:complete len:671 (+),score=191.64 TRINITY_DN4016_c1_g1_i1:113-2125(+)
MQRVDAAAAAAPTSPLQPQAEQAAAQRKRRVSWAALPPGTRGRPPDKGLLPARCPRNWRALLAVAAAACVITANIGRFHLGRRRPRASAPGKGAGAEGPRGDHRDARERRHAAGSTKSAPRPPRQQQRQQEAEPPASPKNVSTDGRRLRGGGGAAAAGARAPVERKALGPRVFRVGDPVRILRSTGKWTPATIKSFDKQQGYTVIWEDPGKGGRMKRVAPGAVEESLQFEDGGTGVAISDGGEAEEEDLGGAGGAPMEIEYFESLDARINATVPRDCATRGLGPRGTPLTCWGPPLPKGWGDLKAKTGCDVFTVPFNPSDDARCLEYISDPRNWAKITPGVQKFDERTVKFKITFRDERLRGIVKVRQRLFPNEAVSEVGSFHADRAMGINRVPVTGWVDAPLDDLLVALRRDGPRLTMIDQFARDSKVHNNNYTEWVDKDFIHFSYTRKWVRRGKVPGRPEAESIPVSVQLWIPDVRPLLDSELRIPWVPHNDSWQRHLSPKHPYDPQYTISFVRQAELAMFDFVLGNGDRSPNKNNFVVGACVHHNARDPDRGCGKGPRHPGPPNFLTLDNGIMFMYPLDGPRTADGPNPLLKHTFCLFERKLLARLEALNAAGESAFADDMQRRLPEPIMRIIGRQNLEKCDRRLRKLLAQRDRCMQQWPRHRVVYS